MTVIIPGDQAEQEIDIQLTGTCRSHNTPAAANVQRLPMTDKKNDQRIYAGLLFAGAALLWSRTIIMMVQGALEILTWWVSALLILEALIDLGCMAASWHWFRKASPKYAQAPLQLGAAAAILHAIRVLIFVLGRTALLMNFDVRPAHRALHDTRWSWGWLYFAAAMSVLGIIGVWAIWYYRKRSRHR